MKFSKKLAIVAIPAAMALSAPGKLSLNFYL